ncbi:hypothetical protein Bp8pC_055 [Bacillus phage Bp8p-C]|uniref:Uncharacterized protein n=2 Tax=Agatevirus Bp8pC TaxID=1910937 RepID=A0A0A0PUN1_9CAUD|nr:hypothetical protein AXJ20_gp055 [Bacillus phage Bp8p-C]YP_009784356.1 hypothetical protein QLX39_gp055 [Bacillus phage Bp8p-T]AHJ87486.1 hypothetical protein Bp8pC_055 [Bacillus phage Bp8p-C]AHJ87697.1 hypothetical protein Bp8pT_055 [Bacillus phage Bp8p-T]
MTNNRVKELAGVHGVTTDNAFEEIVDIVEKHGRMVQDRFQADQPENSWTELVILTYQIFGEFYEFWYQVRTPYTPALSSLAFGFDKLETSVVN